MQCEEVIMRQIIYSLFCQQLNFYEITHSVHAHTVKSYKMYQIVGASQILKGIYYPEAHAKVFVVPAHNADENLEFIRV